MKRIEKLVYRTFHTDYLKFAVESCFGPRNQPPTDSMYSFIDRGVVDTIRYSFDCLDSAVKFTFFMGSASQLPIAIPTNWLTHYLARQWTNLSLADAIGLLSFAWTNQPFWETPQQFQLFQDLRKLRVAMTHPKPLGTKVFAVDHNSRLEELTDPDFLVHSKPIAKFHRAPDKFEHSDAEQALEILLHHLVRLQQLFFQGTFPTQFAYYDDVKKKVLGCSQLLQSINCRFSEYWQQTTG